jgi:hypothetical protein
MSAADISSREPGWPAADDLSLVLERLMSRESSTRKTKDSRRRLANHPLTREYLDAGLRLIFEQFQLASHGATEDGEEWRKPSALFGWLSARKIIDEVTRNGQQHGNQGTFEDRWPYRDYYIDDLLAYSLWARHWSAEIAVARRSAEPLARHEDFSVAVQQAAYQLAVTKLSNPATRLFMLAAAISDRYPNLKAATVELYQTVHARWIPVYQAMIAARGLRLRPDITLQDLADILCGVAEGLGLRALADPSFDYIDHEHRSSLLGKAVLAILAGAVDAGDGRTLTEVIQEISLSVKAAEPI